MTTDKLTKSGNDKYVDPKFYHSVVGSLHYAKITRPDISYAVNRVFLCMSSPLEEHWVVVKWILRYLAATSHYGLIIQKSSNISLKSFTDADWGSDLDDCHSTFAHVHS